MRAATQTQRSRSWRVGLVLTVTLCAATALGARGLLTNLGLVAAVHKLQAEHLEQQQLVQLVRNNELDEAFDTAFEHGDELFETVFNALDGVGANVGQGQRFTRVPRADLTGAGE